MVILGQLHCVEHALVHRLCCRCTKGELSHDSQQHLSLLVRPGIGSLSPNLDINFALLFFNPQAGGFNLTGLSTSSTSTAQSADPGTMRQSAQHLTLTTQ